MSENNLKYAIEAMLFASDKPLSAEQMRPALDNLASNEIRKLIEELQGEYEQANRGIRVAEIAGGFMMVTATGFAPILKKLFKDRHTERLSKQGLETLAIIAYKQPLTRTEIELLRNVNVDGVMKSLLDKNLIRISGRKKTPGRPLVYGTTRQFLEHFGLKSIADLPSILELNTPEIKKELAVENVEVELIPEGNDETVSVQTNEEMNSMEQAERTANGELEKTA
ncbi:MAG: SMC-Scp complex subunit ScpB [Candidatus Omnitrophica bacterium]|nr:SMC-Scp complex subunit ScpB [Candidatus Omnitrophota bacterium]